MAQKSILLAHANSLTTEELKVALGQSWAVTAVSNGPAAREAFEKQSFDAFVADFDLFPGDGAEIFYVLLKAGRPTILLILASESDRSRMIKNVPGQHLFISKPCNAPALKNVIERTLALDISIANEDLRKLVSKVRTFPSMPSIYLEIQSALRSTDVTTEQVSAIIARDMAMTTKLLHVLNSTSFGFSRQIDDLNEAVGILGFEMVKSMIITIQLISEYDHVKPVYFSIDRLWRRSTAVARMARQLTLLHTGDAVLAEASFAAGLLHDMGKAVLASTFDEQYQAAQSAAREQQAPPWEIEKEHFGASHGQIGAYLLNLWGMPLDILETAAMHDHPSRSSNKLFGPLTAVHIAHAWEHELNPENDGLPAPQIDEAYLKQLGVLEKINEWRRALSLPVSSKRVKAAPPRPAARKKSPTSLRPKTRARIRAGNRWAWAVAGVSVLLLLGWFTLGTAPRVAARIQNGPTHRTATKDDVVSSTGPAQVAPAPTSIPAVVTNAVAMASNLPPLAIAFPELKLQGIFYSSNQPSAIINGQLIRLNGEVDGVHVLEIGHSSITVEYQKQRKTLSL